MEISLSPYHLAFIVLLALAAILWTISSYGLRKAKSRMISHFKKFAEQNKAAYTCNILLDHDIVKGEHRNRNYEYKFIEKRGAWLFLTVFLSNHFDFYLRIARKSLRESVFKGKELDLKEGGLSQYNQILVIKTSDADKAQLLLDIDVQAIVIKLFEELKIARLELDRSEIRVIISDPEIADESYFKSILSTVMDFADRAEKKI